MSNDDAKKLLTCIYKVLLLKRLVLLDDDLNNATRGPSYHMFCACIKYGLLDIVQNGVTSGDYISMLEWKKVVNEKVMSHDFKKWGMNCRLYKATVLYSVDVLKARQILSWWTYCSKVPVETTKCRLLVRLLLNCFRLGSERCTFYCNQSFNQC